MISRTLLTVPFQVSRTPLALVDLQLSRRLPEDSMPRLVVDRILGSYDRFAGHMLDDPDLAQRGADRVLRSAKLANAVALEREAEQRREAAVAVAEAGERQAAETAQQAEERLASGLDEADAADRDGKRAAAAQARTDAARKKQRAENRTARRLASVEQKVKRAETTANTRITSAQKTAKAKFDDAATQRATARAKRKDADQLGQLTTAKRQARKA